MRERPNLFCRASATRPPRRPPCTVPHAPARAPRATPPTTARAHWIQRKAGTQVLPGAATPSARRRASAGVVSGPAPPTHVMRKRRILTDSGIPLHQKRAEKDEGGVRRVRRE